MDFSLSPRAEAFREKVLSTINQHLTDEVVEEMHASGTFSCNDLYAAIADAGLLAGSIPGYGDRDPIELYLLFNE